MNPNGVFYRTGSISRRVNIPYIQLDVLERKHSMKILMLVLEKGSVCKTELTSCGVSKPVPPPPVSQSVS